MVHIIKKPVVEPGTVGFIIDNDNLNGGVYRINEGLLGAKPGKLQQTISYDNFVTFLKGNNQVLFTTIFLPFPVGYKAVEKLQDCEDIMEILGFKKIQDFLCRENVLSFLSSEDVKNFLCYEDVLGPKNYNAILDFFGRKDVQDFLGFLRYLKKVGIKFIGKERKVITLHDGKTIVKANLDAEIIMEISELMALAREDESQPFPEKVIFVSGDSDFAPMIKHWFRNNGIKTIAVASRYAMSREMADAADEVVYLETVWPYVAESSNFPAVLPGT